MLIEGEAILVKQVGGLVGGAKPLSAAERSRAVFQLVFQLVFISSENLNSSSETSSVRLWWWQQPYCLRLPSLLQQEELRCLFSSPVSISQILLMEDSLAGLV